MLKDTKCKNAEIRTMQEDTEDFTGSTGGADISMMLEHTSAVCEAELKDAATATMLKGTAVEDAELHLRDDGEGRVLYCGYGGCHPTWLQRFNNPRALLACVCWMAFTQG